MTTMDDVERGKCLRDLRDKQNLTQRQVGDVFGIDKASVSEWERGKSRPDVAKLATLDKLYGDTGKVLDLFGVGTVTPSPSVGDETGELRRQLAEVVAEQKRMSERLASLGAEVARLSRRGRRGDSG